MPAPVTTATRQISTKGPTRTPPSMREPSYLTRASPGATGPGRHEPKPRPPAGLIPTPTGYQPLQGRPPGTSPAPVRSPDDEVERRSAMSETGRSHERVSYPLGRGTAGRDHLPEIDWVAAERSP